MKKIINNKYNLKESEITHFVRKVKLLIINSKDQLLLAYAHNDYEFPGGTQEIGEELIQTIRREILEETGIKLNISELLPFACTIGYYKDWPEKGKNKKVENYYYELKTDKKPNLSNLNLTENEKKRKFQIKIYKSQWSREWNYS